eukprot:13398390-Alexandrium_andersonii.AAC.1
MFSSLGAFGEARECPQLLRRRLKPPQSPHAETALSAFRAMVAARLWAFEAVETGEPVKAEKR